MEAHTALPDPKQSEPCAATRSLGVALLRLQTARELARVHIARSDPETLARWFEHEHRVQQRLAEFEHGISKEGKRAVGSALVGVQELEREVCEFIDLRFQSPAPAHGFFAPLA